MIRSTEEMVVSGGDVTFGKKRVFDAIRENVSFFKIVSMVVLKKDGKRFTYSNESFDVRPDGVVSWENTSAYKKLDSGDHLKFVYEVI